MNLPVTRTNPVPVGDSSAMREVSWEWVCWLKDWRKRYESGDLSPSETNEKEIESYFETFRQNGGFICIADDMKSMPGDARVDFIYTPTVTAAGILNLARINNENLVRRGFLQKTIVAACGRKLMGHGYDAETYMAFQIELLAYGLLTSEDFSEGDGCGAFGKAILNCYRKMSSELINPPEEVRWSGVEPYWAAYCLRLLNCRDNNWKLLGSSPLTEEFERRHRVSDTTNHAQMGDFFDE